MNRGSRLVTAPARRTAQGFNEAPIHESGKCDPVMEAHCGVVASMRPRFMNRGSVQRPALIGRAVIASMRPRFMNRGSDLVKTANGRIARASMRPRFMNRGSSRVVAAPENGSTLQ